MRDTPDAASSADRGFITQRSMALALYGTLAAGFALSIGTDTNLGTWVVVAAVLAELVGFFLAHAYADMLGEHLSRPGTRLWERFEHACTRDLLVLVGGLPVVLLFIAESAAGIDASLGADIALALLVAMLGIFGCVAARRSHASWPAALGEGVLAAALGALVLVFKLLLH
ncbi:MAG: hypothetical protein J2P57_12825 [Acidimicrobiaceae bacterium]|nr:hypothetical protein [Acidimicrobiaceae bacterium]